MRSIANEVNVIGPDTTLQRTVAPAIGLMESLLNLLHSAANEKRGIVFWDDAVIHNQRKSELLKAALDYREKAECVVILLSSFREDAGHEVAISHNRFNFATAQEKTEDS